MRCVWSKSSPGPLGNQLPPGGLGRLRSRALPSSLRPASLSPAGLFVTDYFTRTPRKLNAFRSFTSLELFHFRIPEDTAVAVWNLVTFKEQGGSLGDRCPDRSITV